MILEHKFPTVADLKEINLAIFITLDANDCGYEGTTKEFILNWVHPLFLKAHNEYIREYKPNWNHAMNGTFDNE